MSTFIDLDIYKMLYLINSFENIQDLIKYVNKKSNEICPLKCISTSVRVLPR